MPADVRVTRDQPVVCRSQRGFRAPGPGVTSDPTSRGRRRREQAGQLLLEIYRKRADVESVQLPRASIAAQLAWPASEFDDAARTLEHEGLISSATYAFIDVTAAGVEEAEAEIEAGRLGGATDKAGVLRRQADRMVVLDAAYRRLRDDIYEQMPLEDCRAAMATDDSERVGRVVGWLVDRGLLAWGGFGHVRLTQDGIDAVEHAEQEPQDPVFTGLASYVTIIHGDATNVNIAQGSPHASQSITVSHGADCVDELLVVLAGIREDLGSIEESVRPVAAAYITALEAESNAGRSDSGPVRSMLRELYGWVKPLTTSVAAGLIVDFLKKLGDNHP